MTDLTNRQREFLVFIINHRAATGSSPSLKQIATNFAVSVPSTADVVNALISKGILDHAAKQARSLIPGPNFLAATTEAPQ